MGIFDSVKKALGDDGLALVQETGLKLVQGKGASSDELPPPSGDPVVSSKPVPEAPPTGAPLTLTPPSLTSQPIVNNAAKPISNSVPPVTGVTNLDKVLQLNELLNQGLISKDEFTALKGDLLP